MMFWGSPGVGKSDIVESIGREWGMHVEVLSPGERGEGAFGVVPVPMTKNDGKMLLTYPMPDYTEIFEDDGRGIIFLDELPHAPVAIRAAMYGLIQARRLGSSYLGGGVRVLAAGNPVEDGGGHDLTKPAANRMAHVQWDAPDATQWTQWLVGNNFSSMSLSISDVKDPLSEETRVLSGWDTSHAATVGLIAGFIRKHPEALHVEPANDDPKASRAWASRRTWELATRAITGAKVHDLSGAEEQQLIASFVGDGAATALFKYRQDADLPDPIEVLDGNYAWEPDSARLDRTMAVLSACASVVLSPVCQNKDNRIEAMWGLLGKLTEDMRDIALVAADPLIQKDVGTNTKGAIKVLAKLHSIVQAAKR